MADKAQIRLRNAPFPPGTTVGLYDRVGDWFNPNALGKPVTKGKVDKTSEVKFDGLPDTYRYWAAAEVDGDWIKLSVTAKNPPEAKPQSQQVSAGTAAQTVSPASREPRGPAGVIQGARDTASVKVAVPEGASDKAVKEASVKQDADSEQPSNSASFGSQNPESGSFGGQRKHSPSGGSSGASGGLHASGTVEAKKATESPQRVPAKKSPPKSTAKKSAKKKGK